MATRERCPTAHTKLAPPPKLPRSKHPRRLQNLQKSLQKPDLPDPPDVEVLLPKKPRLDLEDPHDLATSKTTFKNRKMLPIDRPALSYESDALVIFL
jgi:hypothetical protein